MIGSQGRDDVDRSADDDQWCDAHRDAGRACETAKYPAVSADIERPTPRDEGNCGLLAPAGEPSPPGRAAAGG